MTTRIETKDQGAGMKQGHALDLKLPIGGSSALTASCSPLTAC